MIDNSDASPNMGIWIRVHGFHEHIEVLLLLEFARFPSSKVELDLIWVEVNGVSNMCRLEWGHNVIGAVKSEANDECLGCKSERRCE